MDNTTAMPTHVTLQPLREFHIDQGQGRTVAVLFRVAVDDHRARSGGADQQRGNQQAPRGIGAKK